MHQSLQGHTRGCPAQSPEPKPRPPSVAGSTVQGSNGSRGSIPSGALHLATFLAESMGHLWGCFWPASQSAPLLPRSLPRLRQPDQVLGKYTPSWVYLGLGIAGSGTVCSWTGRVGTSPLSWHFGPLQIPSPHPCTHDVSSPLPASLIPSPAGRCGAEPRARWLTPRRHRRRIAVSPACLCW